jgi:hypothetical protein
MIRMGITKKENYAALRGITCGNDAKNTRKSLPLCVMVFLTLSPAIHPTSPPFHL